MSEKRNAKCQESCALEDNEVHIWRVSLPLPKEKLIELEKTLSQDELERLSAYQFERDKERFIASRGSLRTLLTRYLQKSHPKIAPKEIHFSYEPRGKPYIEDSAISFNLAHSGNLVLIAVIKNKRIGVDVEEMRTDRNIITLAKQLLSEKEYGTFLTLSEQEQLDLFYTDWTRKEAFLKASGYGLTWPIQKELTNQMWHFLEVDVPTGYKAAVTLQAEIESEADIRPRIVCFDY